MRSDAKLPTDAQRRRLCEMMHHAFVEMRLLGWGGKAEQAAELADAFHNLPVELVQGMTEHRISAVVLKHYLRLAGKSLERCWRKRCRCERGVRTEGDCRN